MHCHSIHSALALLGDAAFVMERGDSTSNSYICSSRERGSQSQPHPSQPHKEGEEAQGEKRR